MFFFLASYAILYKITSSIESRQSLNGYLTLLNTWFMVMAFALHLHASIEIYDYVSFAGLTPDLNIT